jgi:hypothetical protein
MSFVKLNYVQIQQRISELIKEYALDGNSYLIKKATALAYADFLMEDPELVTDRHIKILEKNFTSDQIIAITNCVLEQICEKAYAQAFRLRCSRILAKEPFEA